MPSIFAACPRLLPRRRPCRHASPSSEPASLPPSDPPPGFLWSTPDNTPAQEEGGAAVNTLNMSVPHWGPSQTLTLDD